MDARHFPSGRKKRGGEGLLSYLDVRRPQKKGEEKKGRRGALFLSRGKKKEGIRISPFSVKVSDSAEERDAKGGEGARFLSFQ